MKSFIYQGFSEIVSDVVTVIEYRDNDSLLKIDAVRFNGSISDDSILMSVIDEITDKVIPIIISL